MNLKKTVLQDVKADIPFQPNEHLLPFRFTVLLNTEIDSIIGTGYMNA